MADKIRIEDLPENKKVNITIRKTHFWLTTLTVLFVFIGSFIVYPIVYVQDKNYTLDENVKAIAYHEQRLKALEGILPKIDEANRQLLEVITELKSFRAELNESKEEWLKLFRDFDLKKKK